MPDPKSSSKLNLVDGSVIDNPTPLQIKQENEIEGLSYKIFQDDAVVAARRTLVDAKKKLLLEESENHSSSGQIDPIKPEKDHLINKAALALRTAGVQGAPTVDIPDEAVTNGTVANRPARALENALIQKAFEQAKAESFAGQDRSPLQPFMALPDRPARKR